MNAHLAEILKKLPHTPGVYLMKNAEGEVIYVGKAKSLHNRVHSYFQNRDALTPKTRALVEHIADIETVCVNSPQEALILENNFIKQYKPKYNIMLRDDKRYPFLCLTESEEFPRLILVRSPKADGNSYFGPYVSGLQRKELEQLLRELFPLRLCNAKSWSKNHRPCLNYHIGKCHAPCAGNISAEDYAELVAQCKLFLNGKTEQVTTETEKKMKQAAAEQRFEEAAALRDRLFALQTLMQKQQLESGDVTENRDFIAIACRDDQCIAQVFLYRNGKVVGREHFKLQNPAEEEAAAVMARFLSEYYEGSKNLPKEICLNIEPEDKEGLEAWLSAQNGKKVQLSLPQRGDRKKLMQLVQHNAELVLTERLESKAYKEQKAALALEQLREVLQLEKTPYRMECYDISHFQGTHTVGS
ncbi:MAG: excinuclease ABC subunit UvrC, partial [Firmicutes bacterium]|nr:excinuclease ABC subunit UvrC [Bacillota bacterium]